VLLEGKANFAKKEEKSEQRVFCSFVFARQIKLGTSFLVFPWQSLMKVSQRFGLATRDVAVAAISSPQNSNDDERESKQQEQKRNQVQMFRDLECHDVMMQHPLRTNNSDEFFIGHERHTTINFTAKCSVEFRRSFSWLRTFRQICFS
jgi:hypothetical protein